MLLKNANRKPYTIYRMEPLSMNDLEYLRNQNHTQTLFTFQGSTTIYSTHTNET